MTDKTLMNPKVKYCAHVRKEDSAKQALKDHLCCVSKLAGEFTSKIGLRQAGEILGLFHDMGKFSGAFQDYLASGAGTLDPDADNYVDARGLKGKIDHSSAGAQHLWKNFEKIGAVGQGRLCGQILALCIASHHSGMIDVLNEDGTNIFVRRMNKDDDKTHYQECCQAMEQEMGNPILKKYLGKESVKAVMERLKTMVTFSPALPYGLSQVDAFTLGLVARFLLSCLVDADRLDSAEFEEPGLESGRRKRTSWLDWSVAIERLEKTLSSFDKTERINKIRHRISEECLSRATESSGIYTLSVPTGGGKTLLTLRYALRHAQEHDFDRIIYIVPFTTIIEQNAEQVRTILEQKDDTFPWILEHHSNIEPERETWFSKLTAENWDAPIVFTTMVQFLEALFGSGNTKTRRMHQLAKSVLIFDEIQSLPIQCTHMFCNALNFLTKYGGSTAILCTATQPTLDRLSRYIGDSKKKKEVEERGELLLTDRSELVADREELFQRLKRVKIHNRCRSQGWEEKEISNLVLEKLSRPKGMCNCLVIVNTKKWARRLYKSCSEKAPSDTVFHLSTAQCPAHRKKTLETIIKKLSNDEPVICISTQLIEAGVDIDFATVVRFLAGLDSIAQAAGRCNRHGKLKDSEENLVLGEVFILNPREENLSMLQEIAKGREKTLRILDEFKEEELLHPEAMERYFSYYFYDRHGEMVFPFKGKMRKDNLLNLLAWNSLNGGNVISHKENHNDCNPEKIPLLRQSFQDAYKTFRAIDAPTYSLIIPYNEGKKIIAQLCSFRGEFDMKRYRSLLKKAQEYSVNVFPHTWGKLEKAGAIHCIEEGEDVFYLEETFYSPDFGVSEESECPMEPLIS